MMVGYELLVEFYIFKFVEGIVILGCVFVFECVIVCMFDFKFNEYVNFVGG